MKKLLFCFCMALFINVSMVAQGNTFAKASMVVIVSQAKSNFTKGTSYKDWLTEAVGQGTPSVKEEAFLKELYGLVSNGSNAETVFKNYNGASLMALAKDANGIVLAQANAKCGFWCSIVKFIVELFIELEQHP